MSDFDKEAEREKLREKYERDKADREATQHMSDLLLKGATMTNTHCGVCGDPLFEQDGTTFCPSCHGSPGAVEGQGGVPQQSGGNEGAGTPVESGAAADAGAGATGSATDADTDTSGRTQDPTASPAHDRANADSSGTQIDVSSPSGDPQPSERARDSTATGERTPDESTPSQSEANANANTDANAGRPAPTSTANRSSGDLADTRAALRGTLEYFSQEAAATDDPRYAKECLEAAREAAETLSALR